MKCLDFLVEVTEYAYFWNGTSATIHKKPVDEEHFTCHFTVLIDWKSYFFLRFWHTHSGFYQQRADFLLPIFKSKITVNSVRVGSFYAVFRLQFRCFVQMNLNINQRFDKKKPGFRWVEWIDTIKMKQKENSQVILRNID